MVFCKTAPLNHSCGAENGKFKFEICSLLSANYHLVLLKIK